MPVYEEKIKDKKTGKMIPKLVGSERKKQYYIRTYVTDEFGNRKQVTRHNKQWLGLDGKNKAQQEENYLKLNFIYQKENLDNNDNNKHITFRELFYLKMKNDELHNKNSLSTRITYEQRMTSHVFPIIGDKNIYNFTRKDFELLIIHLKDYICEKGTNKGQHLSNKYINDTLMVVRAIINFGINFYNLNVHTLKFINFVQEDRDKIKKSDPLELMKKKTTISSEDWVKIAKAMEETIKETKPNDKLFVSKMMLFLTTEYILLTRVGETQGMTYSNLLIDYSIYNLYEAYNARTKTITPTKNRDSRILYIPTSLLSAFQRIYNIDSQRENFTPNEFIFGSEKVFARSTVDRYRKKLLKKAGINYLTNHELRHAGISNAVHNKVDASAVADMAGHDKKIMYEVYVQTLKESNHDLINTLDKLLVPNF